MDNGAMQDTKQKRKQKLIDKKFQLKTTFSVISIILIIALCIISLLTGYIIWNNARNLESIQKLHKVVTVEDDIVKAFVKYSQGVGDADLILASNKVTRDHDTSMESVKTHIEDIKNNIQYNFFLLSFVIVILVILCLVMYVYLVNKTNSIAGPIHVLTNHVNDLLKGKSVEFRGLRKNDEFKELYELVAQLGAKLIALSLNATKKSK